MPCPLALSVCMSLWRGQHGYQPHQRDAMLKQAYTESRHQPCAVNHSSESFGLFQWNGARRHKLLAMTRGQCPTWEAQLAFADTELRTIPCYRGFWRAKPGGAHPVLGGSFGGGGCSP